MQESDRVVGVSVLDVDTVIVLTFVFLSIKSIRRIHTNRDTGDDSRSRAIAKKFNLLTLCGLCERG